MANQVEGEKKEDQDKGGWMMLNWTWGCGYEKLETKSFGQNRMGICSEGRQGQNLKSCGAEKEEVIY